MGAEDRRAYKAEWARLKRAVSPESETSLAKRRAREKERYSNNPQVRERAKSSSRRRYHQNTKETLRYSSFMQANLGWRWDAASNARRRSALLRAIPPWADNLATQRFYDEAARLTQLMGVPWHVDHVVPLNSPLVCGLHWHGNLQLLPAAVNLRKSNRTWPDAP